MTALAQEVSVRAHLLIQADPGAGEVLRDYLEALPGIVDASRTTGAFDAVVRVAVRDERELQRILVATRYAPGLARLCLCRSPSG